MARILLVYSSSYRHIGQIAQAVAEGARFQIRHVAESAGEPERSAGEQGSAPAHKAGGAAGQQ